MRRTARAVAVLLGALLLAGGGTLAAAGVAWSDGGRRARSSGGRTGGHPRSRAATTVTQTTSTTTTITTTAKTSTHGTGGGKSSKNSGSSKTKAQSPGKSSSAPKKPKPKPKPKPVARLSAALLSAIAFPQRALGLWTSPLEPLTAKQIHVSENGRPIGGLALTPLSHAPTADFGVVVVLDESSSLSSTSRGLELGVAEAIAGTRSGSERLGFVTFGATPNVMLPPTKNQQLIRAALSSQPLIAPGSSVVSALKLAYAQLQQAGVPVGAVVVVTAGKELANPASEGGASQAGLRLGYQTFASDIVAATADGSSSGGQDSDAAQEKALGAQLGGAAGVWRRLMSGYEVAYRSTARPKQAVSVAVSVDGVTGTPEMQYTAIAPAPNRLAAPSPGALSQYPGLSRLPAFSRYTPSAALVVPGRSRASFWSSPLSLIVVSVACALLLGLALMALVSGVGRSAVESRVASFIPQEGQDDPAPLVLSTPGVPGILARRRWWPAFVLLVEVARFRRSPVSLVRLAIGGSLVAAVIFTFLLGSIAGFLLGLPVGPLVLYAVVKRAARKSRARFAEQLPANLQDMAGAMRGGRSMAGAMLAVVDGADEPILGEFERVVADEQLGRPLETSLHTMAQRMKSEDIEQVALVAALHRRSGSSVAEALDHVAEGARERAELVRELNSLTGQARLSSRILTGLPVVLVIVLNLIAPGYMRPLTHTVGGIVVMIVGAFMVLTGWLVMRRIVNVEV